MFMKCLNSTKPPLPWEISGCAPAYPVILITINCNILSFSSIKADITQTIESQQEFIMLQVAILGRNQSFK